MPTTYDLNANPFWFVADNNGNPNIGGRVEFYDVVNQQKAPVYSIPVNDPSFLYPNPLTIPADGTIGPLYFESDIAYIIIIFDVYGNAVRSVSPVWPATGGGVTPVFIYGNYNYFPNSSFSNNLYITSPVPTGEIKIAAGNWYFNHNVLSTADVLAWERQNTNWMSPVQTPEGNPPYVFTYSNPGPIGGETIKELYCRFDNVTSFAGKAITLSFWQSADTATTGNVYVRQAPAVGATITQQIGTFLFDNSGYSRVVVNAIVPSVGGMNQTPGGYVDFIIELTLDQAGKFWIGTPMLQIGTITSPSWVFESTSDDIYRSLETSDIFQTGDVKFSYALSMSGWLLLDDTTIGKGGSFAVHQGDQYYALFKMLWTNISSPSLNLVCTVYDGFVPTLGANADAAWNAGYQLTLPASLGRAFSNAGRPIPYTGTHNSNPDLHGLGAITGWQKHNIQEPELAGHSHPISFGGFGTGNNNFNIAAPTGSPGTVFGVGPSPHIDHAPVLIGQTGASATNPLSLMQPTTFINAFIKL